MPNNDASLSGKGSEIMLPARGNPFAGQTDAATPDLSPEDVAAMFKEPIPTEASPAPIAETEPVAFGMMAEAPATFAVPAEEASLVETPPTTEPTPIAETEMPPAVAEAGPPRAEASPTVVTDQPGVRASATSGGGGEGVPSSQTYAPGATLPADESLVKLFVTDDRLMMLWMEMDALEEQVAKTQGLSRKGAREILDRLASARNNVMSNRDRYEEARREVAESKYLLDRLKRSSPGQHAQIIFAYLCFVLVLVLAGLWFGAGGDVRALIMGEGTPLPNFIWVVLIGGLGGITGAMFGLWKHVAGDQDYDPQFALWYYTNPLMGVVLGALSYLLIRGGLLVTTSGEPSEPSPYVMWVFAFAVGYQQNLALSLLNAVLKRIIPAGEKAKAD